MRRIFLAAALVTAALAPLPVWAANPAAKLAAAGRFPTALQLTACTAGATNCSDDTANDDGVRRFLDDPYSQERIYWLWVGQCQNIHSEAASAIGHSYREAFCLSVDAGKVPTSLLMAAVLDPATIGEILAGGGTPGGNLVDADVDSAIDGVLTVTVATAATTATGSTGAYNTTVASGTGIDAGMSAYGLGIPTGTVVVTVSGTTVTLSQALTAAESSAPVAFSEASGLPTRSWQ